MNILTLKIPEELDQALQEASVERGMTKSAIVREAIEQALGRQAEAGATAERWLAQWRGALAGSAGLSAAEPVKQPGGAASGKSSLPNDNTRVAHILSKHLR
jgi:predicted transcriptional regulator